tara:strand:+ start:596 stop:769 length:174 start_codon:yes stop_codon:yes gene_type:complete
LEGVDRAILRKQRGHTDHKSGAIGFYDRTNLIERRRDLLKTWTKELIKPEDEVVVIE